MKTRIRKFIFIPISLLLMVSSYIWAADKKIMLYPVVQNRKYGYMNRRGKIVIEPKFDYAWSFSEGLAGIVIDRKGGYIDPKGNIVIQPQFDRGMAVLRRIGPGDNQKEGILHRQSGTVRNLFPQAGDR